MMQMIRRNFGYKLISLVIAILLYVIANNQLNPRTMNDVYVAPEVTSIPLDLVVRAEPAGFTVTVAGLTSSVATFKSEPVKATVDLSHAHIGTQKLPIHYKLPSSDIDDSGWPVTAEVTLEQKARQPYDVDVQHDADPPAGYAYLDPVANPSGVSVSGLLSDVRRVARVIAVVPKDPSAGDIDQSVDLVAQDDRRQTVDTVQIDPDRVQVHIGLKLAEMTKAVFLSAAVTGKVAPGFAIANITFQPAMLTLTGTQETLRGVSTLNVPVAVDSTVQGTVKRTVAVTLPTGVSLQNPGDKTVQVQIDVAHLTPVVTPVAPGGAPSTPPVPPALSDKILPTPSTAPVKRTTP